MQLEVGVGKLGLPVARWSLDFWSQLHNWRFSLAGSPVKFEIGSWEKFANWEWQLATRELDCAPFRNLRVAKLKLAIARKLIAS